MVILGFKLSLPLHLDKHQMCCSFILLRTETFVGRALGMQFHQDTDMNLINNVIIVGKTSWCYVRIASKLRYTGLCGHVCKWRFSLWLSDLPPQRHSRGWLILRGDARDYNNNIEIQQVFHFTRARVQTCTGMCKRIKTKGEGEKQSRSSVNLHTAQFSLLQVHFCSPAICKWWRGGKMSCTNVSKSAFDRHQHYPNHAFELESSCSPSAPLTVYTCCSWHHGCFLLQASLH